jgi:hypothetical protein
MELENFETVCILLSSCFKMMFIMCAEWGGHGHVWMGKVGPRVRAWASRVGPWVRAGQGRQAQSRMKCPRVGQV